MKLEIVKMDGFAAFCMNCGKSIKVGEVKYADLGGEPFSYYCRECAESIALEQIADDEIERRKA